MTTVWQNIPSILNSVIHQKIIIMSKWHLVYHWLLKNNKRWTRGLCYKFQFMAKHERWWACGILGVGLADEGLELVTLTGRQKLFHRNSQYSDTQHHRKHQTTARIPPPSQRDWVRLHHWPVDTHNTPKKNQNKTLCNIIKLKSWPQSTKWKRLFTVFFHR